MAKLIITREGVVEQTVQLSKEHMSVGRHRHNDIVLNHPAVSGEHGVITTILDDSFLEDLNSTNGTFVNGHRIGKHFLQHKDVIKMAKYHLEFIQDGIRPLAAAAAAAVSPAGTAARSALPGAGGSSAPAGAGAAPAAAALQASFAPAPAGRIELMNGPNAGKSLTLSKPATSLGRPGVQVVVISRTPLGYTATHVEGDLQPLLNDNPLGRAPQNCPKATCSTWVAPACVSVRHDKNCQVARTSVTKFDSWLTNFDSSADEICQ
ncbi:FHA domain-containing protein [Pseudoduganella sp. UC29_106]|uniref:FHA domain-containing protein n=1 Tax=Pseudoduganella sp. UC29_106 TaxID=3374553 RepID=UPI0037562DD6